MMSKDEQNLNDGTDWLAAPPRSRLPPGFRLLCVGNDEPDWVGLTLQLDIVGCHDPKLTWVSTPGEAMALLRHESFDCIIVADAGTVSDEDGEHHSVALIRAIRASGCGDPLIILTAAPSESLMLEACQQRCELLVSPVLWSTRCLTAVIERAIHHIETAHENHQLAVANHRRLVRERDEADQLLRQQREIIHELELLARGPAAQVERDTSSSALPAVEVPDEIGNFYQELLRTYVIMGSGNLGGEIAQLARILAELGLSPRNTLALHLAHVERLVRGLGNRSTRHVMARADLLALELIIHLGECFQQTAVGNEG